MANNIGIAMKKQFEESFNILYGSINNLPDDKWLSGPNDIEIPARICFHIAQALDAHIDDHPGDYDWSRFNIRWMVSEKNELLSKTDLIKYLDEVKEKTYSWCNYSDDILLGTPAQPTFFNIKLAEGVYAIRHLNYHIGELNSILGFLEITPGQW